MLGAIKRTFNAIFKGGCLSRQDWLYQFVAFWHDDEAELMSDTCRLRALLLGAIIQTLLVLVLIGTLLAVVVFVVVATVSEPLLGVWIVAVTVGVTAVVLIGGAAADRWSLVGKILDVVFKILVVLTLIAVAALCIWIVGSGICGILGMETLPAGAEMAVGVTVVIALAAVVGVGILFFGIIFGWFKRFQAWAAETGFWLWLKGWACQKLELVD